MTRMHLPERWYRDVWLLLITLMVAYTMVQHGDRDAAQRARSLQLSCAFANGISIAGYDVILKQSPPNRDGRADADAFARTVARTVSDEVGLSAAALVGPEGQLNCDRAAARVGK